jgi:hypothetical protein
MKEDAKDLTLLREFVGIVLTEDDGGDVAGGLMAGAVDAMPYGMSYGNKSVIKAFSEPFVDAVKVAIGKTKEVAVRTQTLAKVAFEALAITLLPVLDDDYREIFAAEKKRLGQLRQEYGPAYEAVWAAFDKSDLKVLAFLYDPYASGMILTYFGGKAALGVAVDTLDTLTGGWLKSTFGVTGTPRRKRTRAPSVTGTSQLESIERLNEADSKVTVDMVKQALQQPGVRKLQQAARSIVKETLSKVLVEAQSVLKATSVDDLLKKAGSRIPSEALQKLKAVPTGERQVVDAALLKTLKSSAKSYYVKNLQGQVKRAIDAGVPEQGEFVTHYNRVIDGIKAL